jgi:hypothetical protein
MKYAPLTDGTDHINIYSAGKTLLGKALSNFAFCTLVVPEDGAFNSIEGYWYFLLTPEDRQGREKLRDLWGFEAKKHGQNLVGGDWPAPKDLNQFKVKIKLSMKCKIDQNPVIKEMLIKSELPFTHYYVFDGKCIRAKGCKWIIDEWERIRKELKNES